MFAKCQIWNVQKNLNVKATFQFIILAHVYAV